MDQLYQNLVKLSTHTKSFYYVDQYRHNKTYRIFLNRYVESTEWQLPNAEESRGIMYEIENDQPICIVSRPMQKFFNKDEIKKEYSTPKYVMNKIDGSLISTYIVNDRIYLKSKGSIQSDHVYKAEKYLESNQELYNILLEYELSGYTVNLEYINPISKYRIVIGYPEEKLIILNCRHRETGEYISFDQIPFNHHAGLVNSAELETVKDQIGIEGYVVIDTNNNWYKLKTDWYISRHRAKDYINQLSKFIELVITEESDDIYQLIIDQPEIYNQLKLIESKVKQLINSIIQTVQTFYISNQHSSRKDYAIAGKTKLTSFEFALAMECYKHRSTELNWDMYFISKIDTIFKPIIEGVSTND